MSDVPQKMGIELYVPPVAELNEDYSKAMNDLESSGFMRLLTHELKSTIFDMRKEDDLLDRAVTHFSYFAGIGQDIDLGIDDIRLEVLSIRVRIESLRDSVQAVISSEDVFSREDSHDLLALQTCLNQGVVDLDWITSFLEKLKSALASDTSESKSKGPEVIIMPRPSVPETLTVHCSP